MLNKFVMSRRQNELFIQKNLDHFIYQSMRLARYDVTEEQCINGIDPGTEEGKALENFRKCYSFLMRTADLEPTYSYLLDLHWILMDGLMDLINNALTEEQVDYLNQMINQPAKANTEIAIDVMLYILNKQLFADGDVRVALMFANKIMLDNGCGFISIPEHRDEEFRTLLKAAHHSENTEEFKKWIFTWCIKGVKTDYFN